LGTAYTFLTSENSRHLPKLIEVLKEANQPISDSVLNLMARTGSRMNNGRGFSRGGYQNNAHNNNNHFSNGNGNIPRNYFKQNYGNNNENRDLSNENILSRKREISPSSHENVRQNTDGTRIKKFRWDNDGPAPTNSLPINNTRLHIPNTNNNSVQSSFLNGVPRNNINVHYSNNVNNSSSNTQTLPNVQNETNSISSQALTSEYNSMYNIQYYQAIAAAAANNGGAGWQAVAYPTIQATPNPTKN